jgi:hypothetical protein
MIFRRRPIPVKAVQREVCEISSQLKIDPMSDWQNLVRP